MKEVMQQFEDRTSQRFHEYDERMKTTRQKCKDKCDKEIQKIILKDKLEKELMDKFATLQTDIQNDAIPTCVCEKSLEDKMEKGCLRCGGVLGGGIAPTFGLIGSVAINMWKTTEIAAATKAAIAAGKAAGKIAGEAAGKKAVIEALKYFGVDDFFPEIFKSILKMSRYTDVTKFGAAIAEKHVLNCAMSARGGSVNDSTCNAFEIKLGLFEAETGKPNGPPAYQAIPQKINELAEEATQAAAEAAKKASESATAAFETAEKEAIEAASMQLYTTIAYSILAILIIVLIMVIIYLILRYRRKKKMKKKLQYIKLLEE
ncbi:hypothetical protein PFNF54_01994 [Plasmodium falciparum NF54]|nr:hypothetical protein PFNF54_01994 [Plasmodium falciparum NF54]